MIERLHQYLFLYCRPPHKEQITEEYVEKQMTKD